MLAAVLAVVITHAHAITLSPAQPVASSLAIVDGKVAYAGDDEAAARRAAGPGAEVIDVAGRTVVPGFNDAHVHFGISLTARRPPRHRRRPICPRRSWLAAIADGARGRPAGEWLFVDHRTFCPTACRAPVDLDFLGRPVFVVTRRGALAQPSRARAVQADPPRRRRRLHRRPRHQRRPRARHQGAAPSASSSTARATSSPSWRASASPRRSSSPTSCPICSSGCASRACSPRACASCRSATASTTPSTTPTGAAPAPDWVRVDGVKYFHDDWARITRYELQLIYDDVAKADRQRRHARAVAPRAAQLPRRHRAHVEGRAGKGAAVPRRPRGRGDAGRGRSAGAPRHHRLLQPVDAARVALRPRLPHAHARRRRRAHLHRHRLARPPQPAARALAARVAPARRHARRLRHRRAHRRGAGARGVHRRQRRRRGHGGQKGHAGAGQARRPRGAVGRPDRGGARQDRARSRCC